MKELRAELDGKVGLVGNTSAPCRYLMHTDSVGLMFLMSRVKFGDQKEEIVTEWEVKDISEMDQKVEQICYSDEVSREPECNQVKGVDLQDFISVFNPCISWSQLTRQPQTYTFLVEQDMQVKDHKPANIKIYDYYMPGELRCCTAKTTQMYFWKENF